MREASGVLLGVRNYQNMCCLEKKDSFENRPHEYYDIFNQAGGGQRSSG